MKIYFTKISSRRAPGGAGLGAAPGGSSDGTQDTTVKSSPASAPGETLVEHPLEALKILETLFDVATSLAIFLTLLLGVPVVFILLRWLVQ